MPYGANGETNKNAVPAEGGYLRDFHGEPHIDGTHGTIIEEFIHK